MLRNLVKYCICVSKTLFYQTAGLSQIFHIEAVLRVLQLCFTEAERQSLLFIYLFVYLLPAEFN